MWGLAEAQKERMMRETGQGAKGTYNPAPMEGTGSYAGSSGGAASSNQALGSAPLAAPNWAPQVLPKKRDVHQVQPLEPWTRRGDGSAPNSRRERDSQGTAAVRSRTYDGRDRA